MTPIWKQKERSPRKGEMSSLQGTKGGILGKPAETWWRAEGKEGLPQGRGEGREDHERNRIICKGKWKDIKEIPDASNFSLNENDNTHESAEVTVSRGLLLLSRSEGEASEIWGLRLAAAANAHRVFGWERHTRESGKAKILDMNHTSQANALIVQYFYQELRQAPWRIREM